ncbi:hypothetical protein BUALT_BualtUnG0012700 [Buddleja alternifolia]|uniref:Uncharacterized protein n=1 Tax=Buddleja alternifolia TaxID=168488 RepID=A0AAV6W7U9_9LAMI|nr:hypothetical protein BUALT_BualtUnG0012700 [Buddleja alternifolia]
MELGLGVGQVDEFGLDRLRDIFTWGMETERVKLSCWRDCFAQRVYKHSPSRLINSKLTSCDGLAKWAEILSGLDQNMLKPASVDVLSNAFTQGLDDGEFFRSLAKKPLISFDNLSTREEKYVNMEEATQMKRVEATTMNQDEEDNDMESGRPLP